MQAVTIIVARQPIQLALSILNFDFEGERKTVEANLKAIVEKYPNLHNKKSFPNRPVY